MSASVHCEGLLLQRIQSALVILVLGCGPLVLLLAGAQAGASFLLGAALSLLSYAQIRRGVMGALGSETPEIAPKVLVRRFYARYIIAGFVLATAIAILKVSIGWMVAGLSILVPAMLFGILMERRAERTRI